MVVQDLAKRLEASRFTATITTRNDEICLTKIRLSQPKSYCGNHPAACEGTAKHRRMAYLEGADWVEFNDMLNDVLDQIGCEGTIKSTTCAIRKGALRRTHYGMQATRFPNGTAKWNYTEGSSHWANYQRAQAPRSTFPEGTPGTYAAINYHCEG